MAIIEEVNEETNVPNDITTILDSLSNDDKERVTKYIESLQTTILDLGGKLPADDDETEVKDTEMEDADGAADGAADTAKEAEEKTTTKDDDDNMPPQYVSGEDYDSAANFKQQAADAKGDGNNEKALEYYNQAIQAAPPSALLYANRAIVLQKLGQIKAAMTDCDLALEKNPDSAKALKTRGKLYYQQEKWELALKDLNQAQTIDFDPDLVDMLKDLTKKHVEQEKKDAAVRILEEEKLKKRAAEIKKAQQEAAEEAKREQEERAARGSAAAGGMGGMPGGMGGMPGGMGGGMPGGMGGMADMMNDPELQEAMKNPKVVKALSELMEGPGGPMGLMSDPSKLQKLMADPEVGPVLQKLMGKFMGCGAGGMPGAGMGGMPGAGFGGSGTSGGGGGGADDIPDLDDLPDLD